MKLTVKLQAIIFVATAVVSFAAEIAYDDGVPEGYYTWEGYSIGPDLLGAFGTRMTADSYPVELLGVKFGFTRLEYSPQGSTWNYRVLGHDTGSGNPDGANELFTSADINVDGMDVPVWPSFSWYEYQVTSGRLEINDDWWVVCHGHWYGGYANWCIAVDETDAGAGRDRTKTAAGWLSTSDIPAWNGGDLLIRSIVEESTEAVDTASVGRIKALFE